MRTITKQIVLIFSVCHFLTGSLQAQTDMDAIMMNRNQFCNGFVYSHSSWKEYWEATLKRENLNIGKVTTQSVMYMANYGISNNLNVLAAVPYVWTKASAGTMSGLNGLQDLSVHLKWRFLQKKAGDGKLSLFAVGGFSTPLGDYTPDFMPLSIGLGSTSLSGRLIADYQIGKWTVTGSGAYFLRSNVNLDRDSYFDTELRLTDEVDMPDAAQFQLRAGYRHKYWIVEGLLTNWTTLGGFDITRNNMPFVSNRMNETNVGAYLKYTIPAHTNLSLLGSTQFTIAGRNMGQRTILTAGAFYAF